MPMNLITKTKVNEKKKKSFKKNLTNEKLKVQNVKQLFESI